MRSGPIDTVFDYSKPRQTDDMIAFSRLGAMGRLGNQMFQYAFIRARAAELGVGFYCPRWEGDALFDLRDEGHRVPAPLNVTKRFEEPPSSLGFHPSAAAVQDGTDVRGYFQSWRYVQGGLAHEWFKFLPDAIPNGIRLISEHSNRPLAAVHVRMGDYLGEYQDRYYLARRSFYARAMGPVENTHRILVFSDDPFLAQKYVGDLWADAVFVSGLSAGEDLYVMTQCERLACSPSTFSWWAGWLGQRPGRTVVAPREGPFRPGAPFTNFDFWPPNWLLEPALRPVFDSFQVVRTKRLGRAVLSRAARSIQRLTAPSSKR